MKVWKRASGALKDQTSLLKAILTPRSTLRNPDIKTSVIKATTHDESHVDYRNAKRVFTWVRISDDCLYQVLSVLFRRMRRTHSWVVVLKGLMLLHGVFSCKVPGIQEIGQLPLDLLNFKIKHTKHWKMSGLDLFIHAYYVFLDQKSSFIFIHSQEQRKRTAVLSPDERNEEQKEKWLVQDLVWLQKLQDLLDKLLEIHPQSSQTVNGLVLEAMDCIVIEIYDIYSRISNGIQTVLLTMYSQGKNEAKMALSILQKANVQCEEASILLDFCRNIGVGNTSKCPRLEPIPEEVIRELEDIITGNSEPSERENFPEEEVKSIIVVEHHKLMKTHDQNNSISSLKTVITDNWEVFEDEQKKANLDPLPKNTTRFDPLPDLISL